MLCEWEGVEVVQDMLDPELASLLMTASDLVILPDFTDLCSYREHLQKRSFDGSVILNLLNLQTVPSSVADFYFLKAHRRSSFYFRMLQK